MLHLWQLQNTYFLNNLNVPRVFAPWSKPRLPGSRKSLTRGKKRVRRGKGEESWSPHLALLPPIGLLPPADQDILLPPDVSPDSFPQPLTPILLLLFSLLLLLLTPSPQGCWPLLLLLLLLLHRNIRFHSYNRFTITMARHYFSLLHLYENLLSADFTFDESSNNPQSSEILASKHLPPL